MERSREIFYRLATQGLAEIDRLIADRESEQLFLDFKRSSDGGVANRLHDHDRNNLARAISGFGNSEGGVILWGVDCSRDVAVGDVAGQKYPIENAARFKSWLENAISGCTLPSHPTVENQIVYVDASGRGFIATHISKSPNAPHQVPSKGVYYMRVGSSFEPVPHGILSGMFGRSPQPVLIHQYFFSVGQISQSEFRLSLNLSIKNTGPTIASEVFVSGRVDLKTPHGDAYKIIPNPNFGWINQIDFNIEYSTISQGGFKLPPGARISPVSYYFNFKRGDEHNLLFDLMYGSSQSEPCRRDHRRDNAFISRMIEAHFDPLIPEADKRRYYDEFFGV